MRTRLRTVGLLSALLFVARPCPAQEVVMEIGSNLIQNMMNYVTNLEGLLTEIESLENQIDQLQTQSDMLEQLELSVSGLSSNEWGEVQSIIGRLNAAISTGESIAYSAGDLDERFSEAFPGYEQTTDWEASYSDWTDTALDTLRGTMGSAQENLSDVDSLQDELNSLRSDNDNAEGQLAAIQTANRLASIEVEELTKLRQLLAAQMNAYNVTLAVEQQKEAAANRNFSEYVRVGAEPEVPSYSNDSGFADMPTISPANH